MATPAAMAATSFVLAPHHPRLTLLHWREFAGFIGWNAASQLISATNWQVSRLVLGGLVSKSALGTYSLGCDLAGIPEQAIIRPVLRPLMTGFSIVRDEPERLRRAYLRSVATLVTAGAPLLLCISLLAKPAISLALGDKWLATAPVVQWLAMAYIVPLFGAPFQSLALALGRNDRIMRQNLLEFAIRLPLILGGAWVWGVPGVVAAQVVSVGATTLCSMLFVRGLIGISVTSQLAAGGRAIGAALVCAGGVLALRGWTVGVSKIALVFILGGTAAAAAMGYAAGLYGLWRLAGRPHGIESTALAFGGSFAARLNQHWHHPHMPLAETTGGARIAPDLAE